jgi:hypothetical protein
MSVTIRKKAEAVDPAVAADPATAADLSVAAADPVTSAGALDPPVNPATIPTAQATPGNHRTAPDGRVVFHWTGKDLKADTAALADAIAGAVELFIYRDGLAVLDKAGGLSRLNFEQFRQIIDAAICKVRVVPNGRGGWEREYLSFTFPPPPRPDPLHGMMRPSSNQDEPDSEVLMALYSVQLALRVPRAVE